MTSNEIERIAELERENASLRARLRSAGLMPPPCDLPNDSEIDQLIRLVEAAHPALRPGPEEPHHRRHFQNALHHLCFVRRTDHLNESYALSYFVDEATAWCRRFGIAGGVSLRSFCSAAVASKIRASTFGRFPFDVALALSLGGAASPSNIWRNVLANGLPPPLELKRPASIPIKQQLVFRPTEVEDGVRW